MSCVEEWLRNPDVEAASHSQGRKTLLDGIRMKPKGTRCLATAFSAVIASGCATVAEEPTETVSSKVLSTQKVKRRVDGNPVSVSATIQKGDILSGKVMKQVLCRTETVDQVSYQTHTSRPTEHVGAEAALGGAGILAGAIGAGVASQLSNTEHTDSSGDTSSNRQDGYAVASIFLVAGAVTLAHAVYVAAKGWETVDAPRIVKEPRATNAPWKPCGLATPTVGYILVATSEGKTKALPEPVAGSSYRVPLRSYASVICTDATVLAPDHAPLRVFYSTTPPEQEEPSGGGTATPALLATFDAAACTRLYLSRKQLEEANHLLATAETITDLAKSVRLVESASELAHGLPLDENERKPVLKEVTAAQQAVARRADAQLAKAVAMAEKALRSTEVAQDADTIVNALNLTGMSTDGLSAWNRIYQTAVAHSATKGIVGYRSLDAILRQDRMTQRCMLEASCPPWLSPLHIQDTIQPATESAAKEVDVAARRLTDASTPLAKHITPRSLAAFDAANEEAESDGKFCDEGPFRGKALDESCKHLSTVVSSVSTQNEPRREQMEHSRAATREAERNRLESRAAAKWRKHFADCRRWLVAARQITAVEERGACGADCEAVAQRMRQEKDRLQQFTVETSIENEDLVVKLKKECGAAECEVCPQGD